MTKRRARVSNEHELKEGIYENDAHFTILSLSRTCNASWIASIWIADNVPRM